MEYLVDGAASSLEDGDLPAPGGHGKHGLTVGGMVRGLDRGKFLVLQYNDADTLTVDSNGLFTLPTNFANAAPYAVSVFTNPVGQICTVIDGRGTIKWANVSHVRVLCADSAMPTYSVGGNVSGLAKGASLVLQYNGGDNLTVGANSPFTFPVSLPTAAPYAVSVFTNPMGQTCTVSNGSGTIDSANVTDVTVACVDDAWGSFTTTANSLTLTSSEPLLANSPFFGIEVRKNGVDITDDIVDVQTLTSTSWKYTFGTQAMNTPGATISISLQNRALATPGHYVAVRDTVQNMHQLLSDCQTGTGTCVGTPVPGLLTSVKGMSRRYEPRAIETAPGVYNFSAIFNDAAFLASKGMKLHIIFTVKSFGTEALYSGDNSNQSFDIPSGWDGDRDREVHVYLKDFSTATPWFAETTAFTLDRTSVPHKVILNVAPPPPPTPAPGSPVEQNVMVVYARDPFPAYTWGLSPPVAGWYVGGGGPNTGNDITGSHGFVHMPWTPTCVTWMRDFMAAFQAQWTAAIAAGTVPSDAIDSISIQETANNLVYDSNAEAYRAGLLEYAKFNAKAVRRRALHGQLMNQIPRGGFDPLTGAAMTNNQLPLSAHANSIIPWGARLEGPDLLNNEPSLEDKVYQRAHRDLHDKAMTMIWHQNASYKEPKTGGYYSPDEQFVKAQRGVLDTSTASGTKGLEAEYVFWNMTTKKSGDPWYDFRAALPVIAANPVIQTSGNDKYLWRRAATAMPIGDQSISKVNP